jgi:hypothetical protein
VASNTHGAQQAGTWSMHTQRTQPAIASRGYIHSTIHNMWSEACAAEAAAHMYSQDATHAACRSQLLVCACADIATADLSLPATQQYTCTPAHLDTQYPCRGQKYIHRILLRDSFNTPALCTPLYTSHAIPESTHTSLICPLSHLSHKPWPTTNAVQAAPTT